MKHLDLFSGYGGFTIACERHGIETIGFSEIDKYAIQVLKNHYPNIKNYGDYALYDDTFSLCESSGLTYVETLILDNITRPSAKQDINTDEKIMVFRHGDTEKSSPLDLFVF